MPICSTHSTPPLNKNCNLVFMCKYLFSLLFSRFKKPAYQLCSFLATKASTTSQHNTTYLSPLRSHVFSLRAASVLKQNCCLLWWTDTCELPKSCHTNCQQWHHCSAEWRCSTAAVSHQRPSRKAGQRKNETQTLNNHTEAEWGRTRQRQEREVEENKVKCQLQSCHESDSKNFCVWHLSQ